MVKQSQCPGCKEVLGMTDLILRAPRVVQVPRFGAADMAWRSGLEET
jgi:hypothetical protein